MLDECIFLFSVFQISLRPLLQLVSPRADSTKYPEVTLVVATAVSFFLFYALHACVVATRHALDLAGTPISTYHQWMLKVQREKGKDPPDWRHHKFNVHAHAPQIHY